MTDVTLLDQHEFLCVKLSKGKGRGVFARKEIPKGEVFLIDPIVFVTKDELTNYIYEHKKKVFVALGMGSLINHSAQPNAFWEADVKNKTNPTISFKAYRKIKQGKKFCTITFGIITQKDLNIKD